MVEVDDDRHASQPRELLFRRELRDFVELVAE
jgi:hypothetical protein